MGQEPRVMYNRPFADNDFICRVFVGFAEIWSRHGRSGSLLKVDRGRWFRRDLDKYG